MISGRKKVLAAALALTMMGITAVPVSAASKISKEETVYVITEADGSQNEVTVSDHLKNTTGADTIRDKSNLTDIENVKGEEKFTEGSGDALTWKAAGNDIFYQGSSDEEVPVHLGISYFLNGKEVQGSEMKGASGDVKIVIDYRNEARDDNGITVPFVAMTGFIAEDDALTDIEVDHGKVIDDGEKQIVVAMAAPGLSDALNLDKDLVDLDLEDTVTITAKAKNFDVQDMMTIVTNSLLEEMDADDFGDLDYDDQIHELDKGARTLMDGSRQLYQGIDTLYGKMPALEDGMDQLADGADQLDKGTKSALDGARQLSGGLQQLGTALSTNLSDAAAGVSKMKTGSDQLLDGMKQLESGIGGDGTAENPGAVAALGQVEDGLDQVIAGLESSGSASDEDIAALKKYAKDVSDYMNKVDGVVSKHSTALKAAGYGDLVNATPSVRAEANGVAAGLEKAGGGSDSGLGDAVAALKQAKGGVSQVKDGLGQASSQMPAMVSGMTELNNGLTQMDTMFQKITDMSGQLSGSVGKLVKGSEDLTEGEVQLSGGAKQLAKGMEQLQNKSGQLSGGVSKLDRGSLELSKGMSRLYQDGIRKIVDLYNNDLKGSLDDLQDVMDAGQSYQTFTELPKGMDGEVKFIYKTKVY